jgi:hypothetical protein
MLGVIKLFNKQNCDGCVMADDGGVMFFHRACVAPWPQRKVRAVQRILICPLVLQR